MEHPVWFELTWSEKYSLPLKLRRGESAGYVYGRGLTLRSSITEAGVDARLYMDMFYFLAVGGNRPFRRRYIAAAP